MTFLARSHWWVGAVALATGSAAVCRGQIDFSPRYVDIMADGVSMRTLCLQDGAQRIFLDQPAHWEAREEGGALCLTNAQYGSARIDLRNSAIKLPPAAEADEAWVKAMTPVMLKSLPEGAKNAAMIDAKVSPFVLYNWKSFEFQMSYDSGGYKYLRSVCFFTLYHKGNIEMVTTGLEKDFAPARDAGFAMLTTWCEPPVGVMKRMLR